MALLAGLLSIFVYLWYASRHSAVEITGGALRIHGGIYSRAVPLDDLLVADARIPDLNTETDRKPAWRTNGIGMPGYRAGWFRLRNGDKALAFLTRRTDVVYPPTRKSYVLLLSVAAPRRFLEALQR